MPGALQLGFRLAAELGHERVYAIDWNEAEGYAHGLDEAYAFAQAHQPDLYEQLLGGGQGRWWKARPFLPAQASGRCSARAMRRTGWRWITAASGFAPPQRCASTATRLAAAVSLPASPASAVVPAQLASATLSLGPAPRWRQATMLGWWPGPGVGRGERRQE